MRAKSPWPHYNYIFGIILKKGTDMVNKFVQCVRTVELYGANEICGDIYFTFCFILQFGSHSQDQFVVRRGVRERPAGGKSEKSDDEYVDFRV